MTKFNLQWTELRNVIIDAKDENDALSMWENRDYDVNDEMVDMLNTRPDITEVD